MFIWCLCCAVHYFHVQTSAQKAINYCFKYYFILGGSFFVCMFLSEHYNAGFYSSVNIINETLTLNATAFFSTMKARWGEMEAWWKNMDNMKLLLSLTEKQAKIEFKNKTVFFFLYYMVLTYLHKHMHTHTHTDARTVTQFTWLTQDNLRFTVLPKDTLTCDFWPLFCLLLGEWVWFFKKW